MIPVVTAIAWCQLNGYATMEAVNTGGCENFAQAMIQYIPGGEIVGTDNFVCWDHCAGFSNGSG